MTFLPLLILLMGNPFFHMHPHQFVLWLAIADAMKQSLKTHSKLFGLN